MVIEFDKTGTPEALGAIMDRIGHQEGVKGLLILACDKNGFTPQQVDPFLKESPVPVIGGIFPRLIHNQNHYTSGTLICGMEVALSVETVNGLSDPEEEYDDILEELFPSDQEKPTMLVFVDGFSRRISSLIESLFNIFGLECNYLGGGAGSLDMVMKPCLFTNAGLVQDKGVIGFVDTQSSIGVKHGWTSVSGPYEVTGADRNVINTLDWQPAFKVYKEAILRHSGLNIGKENFFDIAKSYPFGIARFGNEVIVRDPLLVNDDGSMVCVGEIPDSAVVDILNGDASSLVAAARDARKTAEESFPERASATGQINLFMDCISRVLFLEDRFSEELEAVTMKGIPLVGALTIGEIANNRKQYLEFYNKTAVFARLVAL